MSTWPRPSGPFGIAVEGSATFDYSAVRVLATTRDFVFNIRQVVDAFLMLLAG